MTKIEKLLVENSNRPDVQQKIREAAQKGAWNDKAVVINEKGAYKHLNGHTLDVNSKSFYQDLSVERIVLTVNDKGVLYSIDFKFENVIFCNAEKIAQELYDAKNWGSTGALKAWNGFLFWAKVHGFKFNPEYNCPA